MGVIHWIAYKRLVDDYLERNGNRLGFDTTNETYPYKFSSLNKTTNVPGKWTTKTALIYDSLSPDAVGRCGGNREVFTANGMHICAETVGPRLSGTLACLSNRMSVLPNRRGAH